MRRMNEEEKKNPLCWNWKRKWEQEWNKNEKKKMRGECPHVKTFSGEVHSQWSTGHWRACWSTDPRSSTTHRVGVGVKEMKWKWKRVRENRIKQRWRMRQWRKWKQKQRSAKLNLLVDQRLSHRIGKELIIGGHRIIIGDIALRRTPHHRHRIIIGDIAHRRTPCHHLRHRASADTASSSSRHRMSADIASAIERKLHLKTLFKTST